MLDEKFLNDAQRELGEFNASVVSLKKELLPPVTRANSVESKPAAYYHGAKDETSKDVCPVCGKEKKEPFGVLCALEGTVELIGLVIEVVASSMFH